MPDAVAISISALEGSPLALDGVYTVVDQAEPLDGATTVQRITASSILIDGDDLVHYREGNKAGRMQVRVWANGDAAVRNAVDAVTAIVSQAEWLLVVETDAATETWRCQVAQRSVSRSWQGFWDPDRALVTLTYPVYPYEHEEGS